MKNKIQMAVNILLAILMPFMMYININNTRVNVAAADILLILVGILFFTNIKEFFIQKRWLCLLYFIGLLLSLFLSQYMSQSNEDFLHVGNNVMLMEMAKTLVVAMYFFTVFIFIKSERDLELSLVAISLSSIPVIFIGATSYIYFLFEKDFFINTYKMDRLRFIGSFEDPNLCAFYFILIFFVSLLNFKIQKNKFLRFLMLGTSILSLIIITLTMSRGGWLALTGAVAVFILLNIKSFKKESLLMVIPIIIIVLLFVDLDYNFQRGKVTNEMVNRVQNSILTEVDEIDRVQLMKAAFAMGNDNFFFGVGKGSFPLNSYKYLSVDNMQYKMQYIPHNTILGFYAQQGIVGVLIFITLPGYILYRMIKFQRKQNMYLIPLYAGLFIHSMTINIENIRFLWYMMGLTLAAEKVNVQLDFVPTHKMKKRTFVVVLAGMLLLAMISYIYVSRKIIYDIYSYKGVTYERTASVSSPGDYQLAFDIHTDNNLHSVEVYDGNVLQRRMVFKSAYGFVNVPVHINEDCKVVFKSNENGWMRVKNAYIIGDNVRIPLYDYILLPRFVEDWANSRGFLVYRNEPSFKTQIEVGDDKLSAFEILDGKVIRYSNLSHVFQFELKSKRRVDTNYQLELLLEYPSISGLLPDEYQRNLWAHRFTLSPLTGEWGEGQEYKVKTNRLFSSEDFELYGRYYDYANKIYSQESYFPIQYDIVKENQDIIELGESRWVNIRYNKDKDESIHMTYNGWVESGKMNIEPGDYNITFKAQGSYLEEYSKIRLCDSNLNEIAEITLDGTMKEYTIRYHADEDQQGISFVLELINYKSEEGIGDRKVLLEDWLKVK